MNKKGFTLIEILAVIVVISIVAVIASPLVSSVIEETRRDAFEDSVYGLIKAVDMYKAEKGFNVNVTFTVSNGKINPVLDTKGSINGTGTIILNDDGLIYVSIAYDKWCASKEYDKTKITVTEGSCVTNSDISGANPPTLLNNMIAVRWDGNKWVKADYRNPSANSWYTYGITNETRNWANAVVVKESGIKTRQYYLSDNAKGNEVFEADILAYFVWIPRYNYAIPAGTGARTISIRFENGIAEKQTGSGVGTSYLTHPAFTMGNDELTGIWVSKFEVGGTTNLVVSKPGVKSLNNEVLAGYHDAAMTMQLTNNAYGFVASQAEVHVIKNTEWSAVAYLSQSEFGKNAQIWKNPSTDLITGCAGTTANALAASGCSNIYSSANGQQASTTGNIYGVYDMVGGGIDIVMGNYNNTAGGSGFYTFPNGKYYNQYQTSMETTACAGSACLGHALSETSGWYSGVANMPDLYNPWLIRGGSTASGSIFTYDKLSGNEMGSVSTHFVVSKK